VKTFPGEKTKPVTLAKLYALPPVFEILYPAMFYDLAFQSLRERLHQGMLLRPAQLSISNGSHVKVAGNVIIKKISRQTCLLTRKFYDTMQRWYLITISGSGVASGSMARTLKAEISGLGFGTSFKLRSTIGKRSSSGLQFISLNSP